jgi:hypothetical protein
VLLKAECELQGARFQNLAKLVNIAGNWLMFELNLFVQCDCLTIIEGIYAVVIGCPVILVMHCIVFA